MSYLKISQNLLDGQWEAFLQNQEHAFVQYSDYWQNLLSSISRDSFYLITYHDKDNNILGGLPCYCFENDKNERVLNSVPYPGPMGGPIIHSHLGAHFGPAVYQALSEKFVLLAKELNCLTATFITNPFEKFQMELSPQYTFNNFTQIIDLHSIFGPDGEVNTGKSKYNTDIKRNLKMAEGHFLQFEWHAHQNDDEFEYWYLIHKKRQEELGSGALPKDMLRHLSIHTEHSGLLLCKYEGKILGGCIYTWFNKIVDVFILSTDSAYFHLSPNYHLTFHSLKYFQQLGLHWYNWQSCPRDSGVFQFKKKWGSKIYNYQFLTWTFHGSDVIFQKSLDEIQKDFTHHFLCPFPAITQKERTGIYSK